MTVSVVRSRETYCVVLLLSWVWPLLKLTRVLREDAIRLFSPYNLSLTVMNCMVTFRMGQFLSLFFNWKRRFLVIMGFL